MNSSRLKPFFSIIIPTRNRSKLLQRALKSALDQDFDSYQIIVVDDGSTDDTAHLVKSINSSIVKYTYQDHKERSAARNLGIEHAEGQYICFLDDDDELKSNHLAAFFETIEKQTKKDIIARCGMIKKRSGREIKTKNYQIEKHKNPVFYIAYNMCGVGSLAIPKKCLLSDSFPEDFPHWQDTHLFIRLLSKYPFVQHDSYTYVYHQHEEMGSVRFFQGPEQIQERAELNVAAMDDLFLHHENLVHDFLNNDTHAHLTSEKYLQHAISAAKNGHKKVARNLFNRANNRGIFARNMKLYLHYFRSFFL